MTWMNSGWYHDQECDLKCNFEEGCGKECILISIHGGELHVCSAHRDEYFSKESQRVSQK